MPGDGSGCVSRKMLDLKAMNSSSRPSVGISWLLLSAEKETLISAQMSMSGHSLIHGFGLRGGEGICLEVDVCERREGLVNLYTHTQTHADRDTSHETK